jgi:predicted dehydrogenase
MAPAIGNRQSAIGNPLGVGVIGLGLLWRQRYQPALAALNPLFRVAAVCDQIEEQTASEAKRLRCLAAAGPTALLLDPAVEAVLLLDPQWYGLWPVQRACRLGKPIFCAAGLDLDDAHADALYQQVQAARLPVLMAMTPRMAPALERLRKLLDTRLGPARLVLCESAASPPAPGAGAALDAGQTLGAGSALGAGLLTPPHRGQPSETALLDCCSALLPGDPVSVLATGREDDSLTTLLLEFEEHRAIQMMRYPDSSLNLHRRASSNKWGEDESAGPGSRSKVRLRVVAERGTASAELPRRVSWTDDEGRHLQTLSVDQPTVQVLLEQFYRVVREGEPPEPGLDQAYRLLHWTRAAQRSRAEGRRIEIG